MFEIDMSGFGSSESDALFLQTCMIWKINFVFLLKEM